MTEQERFNNLLEQAYWEFDARHKGYSDWRLMPQSERDAFKAAVRAFVAKLERC